MAEEPLYKAHVVIADPPRGSSGQPPRDEDPDLGTPNEALPPPESLERLALLSTINGTRKSCIDAIAMNVVGHGYLLEVDADHERDTDEDPRRMIREATARLEACAARDTRLENPSLTELLKAVKTDEEEVGWGFIEVSRSRDNGQIDGLFHVPGKRMRRLRSRKGYLLMPPDGDERNATYFANYGTKVEYGRDGRPTRELAEGHEGGWRRNEVICFKLYTSESRDYGLPRDHALAVEYLGDKAAVEANLGYFDSGGALPTVLFVQGEEKRDGSGQINVTVPHEVTTRINAVLSSKSGRGPNGTGRVAIVPLPAGVKAQREELGRISEKDIGYVAFRDDMRQRTISNFRLSPIFLGLSSEGRYDAEVERAITKEQVFDPEQARYERRLTNGVLRDLGFPELRLRLRDLAVENDAARRTSADRGAELGLVSRREWRAAHGMGPLPEAAEGAEPEPGQVPRGWNDELVPAAGRPPGTDPRVEAGDDQRGLRPGLAGRASRNDGQAESRVAGQARRLANVNGRVGRAGARRALERARALPTEE